MGCKSSTEKTEPINDNKQGGGARSQANPTCHFCKKSIPQRELNAHTVQCDQREVTCWHSWCRTIVKQGKLAEHMEECGKKRKATCVKCGEAVLSIEMASHRESCHLVNCNHCPEAVIGRIVKYCPVKLLSDLRLVVGPFANEPLKEKHPRELDFNVARIQGLFRWHQTKSALEDIVFRSMYKEMDVKKEGYAIFKAHDKVTEGHVLSARKSRSLVQSHGMPISAADYFFPTSKDVPIEMKHINELLLELRKGNLPPPAVAWRIFNEAHQILATMNNIQNIGGDVGSSRKDGRWLQGHKTIVVGDLHGQFSDLVYILNDNGMPSASTSYVFNGDFVDRGAQGVEVILVLFSLLIACPGLIALNRGNHECDYMNEEYGFDVEVATKYDRSIYRLVQRCFSSLPLATVVNDNVFVVHGGLPRREGVTLDDIRRVQRFRHIPMPELQQPEEDEIFQDLMWSDPWEQPGWRDSDRGAGVQFGPDITEAFLKLNKLKLVVRSHEEFAKGYEEHHNKLLLTVFSASNYDGPDTNKGAICVFVGEFSEPSFVTHHVDEDEYNIDGDFSAASPVTTELNSTMTLNRTMSFTAGLHSSFAGRNRNAFRVAPKDEVLRTLRERIYQRRHRLLAYFTKLDRTQKGSVWKIEWVEALRNCLNLELPWFFLRRYLAEEDPETHRIHYGDFLSRFHSGLTKLWLHDWEQSMAQQLKLQMRMNQRSHHLQTFADKKVNYNSFCSAMRTVDYTLTDAQLFQLFVFFDEGHTANIDGNRFLNEIENMDANKKIGSRWELDAMEQLQNMTIQGRSQIISLFKITSKDRFLTMEKYLAGMALLSRGMKKQLTKPQQEAIFKFIDKNNEGKVSIDRFLQAFSVYDIDSQQHPLQRHNSVSMICDIMTPTTATGPSRTPQFGNPGNPFTQ